MRTLAEAKKLTGLDFETIPLELETYFLSCESLQSWAFDNGFTKDKLPSINNTALKIADGKISIKQAKKTINEDHQKRPIIKI